jgi:hypothetical protein
VTAISVHPSGNEKLTAMILEKAVNHGGHSENGGKTRAYAVFPDHPLGDYEERPETQGFRRVRCVRRG